MADPWVVSFLALAAVIAILAVVSWIPLLGWMSWIGLALCGVALVVMARLNQTFAADLHARRALEAAAPVHAGVWPVRIALLLSAPAVVSLVIRGFLSCLTFGA